MTVSQSVTGLTGGLCVELCCLNPQCMGVFCMVNITYRDTTMRCVEVLQLQLIISTRPQSLLRILCLLSVDVFFSFYTSVTGKNDNSEVIIDFLVWSLCSDTTSLQQRINSSLMGTGCCLYVQGGSSEHDASSLEAFSRNPERVGPRQWAGSEHMSLSVHTVTGLNLSDD